MICCAKRVSASPRPRPRKSPAGRRIDRAAVKRRAWRTPARVPHQANRYEARSRRGCAAVMIQLRTYVYVDSLQPQLAEYLGTVSQGFLPVPGAACLWLEVSPGMAVHRLPDVALKATEDARQKCRIAWAEGIRAITPDHAGVSNRQDRRGSMILPGQSMFILETEPAGYVVYAANEAEKAARITLVDVKAVGAFGRLTLAGKEADIDEAARAAVHALNSLSGVSHEKIGL